MSYPITQMRLLEAISLFFDACPGPPLARTGLRMAALQAVEGIPELQSTRTHGIATSTGLAAPHEMLKAGPRQVLYLSSVGGVAKRLKCRPAYLSRASIRHGYSFSRALRWIRLLHGMALLAEGFRVDTLVLRLGFSDVAGWSRFTKRLVGRSPSQLPVLPLELWVRKAIDDVFFGLPVSGELRDAKTLRAEKDK